MSGFRQGFRRFRKTLFFAVVVAVAVVGALVLREPDVSIPVQIASRQPDVVRGAYIAKLGDCAACHTSPGGQALAGGTPFQTPFGPVFAANITPDKDTGIGNYTFVDFVRLMRDGVAPGGKRVYPAMPYTSYARTSTEDLQDLFAYLQTQVAPVHQAVRQDGIPWPLNMRWPLAFWNAAFHKDDTYVPNANLSVQWNRGAYLVEGLMHCGTCHTPRGFAMQEVDAVGNTNLFLSGSSIAGSSPPNLRGNEGDGLGRWSQQDIVDLLKTGVNAHSAVTGPMAEVIEHSTQYMSDADLQAVAVYLKSLSPAPAAGRSTFEASDTTLQSIMAGKETSQGGQIYMDSCAACHRLSGSGEPHAFPRLAGSSIVLAQDPSSLLDVILGGARAPSTAGAPSGLAMPPFAWRYDDAQVAALATFMRSAWGNKAPSVTAEQVHKVRAQLPPAPEPPPQKTPLDKP